MHRWGRALQTQLRALPAPLRHAFIGAALVGVPAGIVGLVVGLFAYWPTAWAATLELGVPGAFLGGLLGLLIGSLVSVSRGPE